MMVHHCVCKSIDLLLKR